MKEIVEADVGVFALGGEVEAVFRAGEDVAEGVVIIGGGDEAGGVGEVHHGAESVVVVPGVVACG